MICENMQSSLYFLYFLLYHFIGCMYVYILIRISKAKDFKTIRV